MPTTQPDLRVRDRRDEVMDDPSLEHARHEHALRGLARLNAISGAAGPIWRALAPSLRDLERPARVLDLATGSGDVLLAIAQRARRAGVDVEPIGIDLSERAIAAARRRAKANGINARFQTANALAGDLPEADAVVCSLFVHHLDDRDAETLLRRARDAASRAVVVSDLRRCRAGYALARLASRALTTSDVVRTDALRSVRAALTSEEARDLAARAGLDGATVRTAWPARWLLTWRREP